MDALLASLSAVSLLLLPILGVAVLIFILILLKKVFDLLKKVDKTIDQVDLTLKKIDGPLETVVSISKTIDFVNSAAENAVKTLAITLAKNFSVISNWIKSSLGKKKDNDLEETTEEELGL
jgi:predicted PurR-regulated permease PerM